jgi:restriction system protein
MSRSYKHRRNQKIDALFVLMLLFIYLEVNRKGYVFLYGLLVAVLIIAIKLFVRWRIYRRINSPKMIDIDSMTGLEFERCVAKMLSKQGYKHVRLTERYDLGVDIIASKDGKRWGIQVKRHSGLVKAIAVRQVVTALRKYKCDKALVVTNSTFSNVAKELAATNDCALVDRDQLSKWVAS